MGYMHRGKDHLEDHLAPDLIYRLPLSAYLSMGLHTLPTDLATPSSDHSSLLSFPEKSIYQILYYEFYLT